MLDIVDFFGLIPKLNEDGTLEKITSVTKDGSMTITPAGTVSKIERLNKLFENQPIGTVATIENAKGQIFEIIKVVDDNYFDTIHHFHNHQEATRHLAEDFVVTESFLGHYNWDTLKIIDEPIKDVNPITVENTVEHIFEKDEDGKLIERVRFTQTPTGGETIVFDQVYPVLEDE